MPKTIYTKQNQIAVHDVLNGCEKLLNQLKNNYERLGSLFCTTEEAAEISNENKILCQNLANRFSVIVPNMKGY
jgi:hypothetical protein